YRPASRLSGVSVSLLSLWKKNELAWLPIGVQVARQAPNAVAGVIAFNLIFSLVVALAFARQVPVLGAALVANQNLLPIHCAVLLVRIAPSRSSSMRKTDVDSFGPVTAKTSDSTARSEVIKPSAASIASERSRYTVHGSHSAPFSARSITRKKVAGFF